MAEFAFGKHKRKGRGAPVPRVDLTPMVDLGFLLITFFMFTTSLTDPRSLVVNMPVPTSTDRMAFVDTSTITIIPYENHLYLSYEGAFEKSLVTHPITQVEVRTALLQKQSELRDLPTSFSKTAHKLHVIIKPHQTSKYQDLVAVLDEMTISKVPVYVIDEPSAEENIWIDRFKSVQ